MNPEFTDTAPPSPPQDALGRRFASLRLSLTARCNFACGYCVTDARSPGRLKDEFSPEQFVRALELLRQAGLSKLRLTGGEPLLSASLQPVLRQAATQQWREVALTTNGALLAEKLPILLQHGLMRLNLSLDSLDEARFYRLSRGGNLPQVLRGLEAAVEAGLPVRVNTVLMRGENDAEILSLLDFCTRRGLELRFIELMQMGHLYGSQTWRKSFVGQSEILSVIGRRWSMSRLAVPANATARRWRLDNGGTFGIIANESQPFCAGCDRLRLTANGLLYGCISSSRSFDLRPILPLPDAQALAELSAVMGLAMSTKSTGRFSGETTVMKFLGG